MEPKVKVERTIIRIAERRGERYYDLEP